MYGQEAKMKCQKIKTGYYNLSFTKEDIEGLSKSIFYVEELKKNQALLKSLIDFLLNIRNGFLQISD